MPGLHRWNRSGSTGVPPDDDNRWRTAEEHPTDEDEAVARAKDGDQQAYAHLVARYSALAHRTAHLLGAGHEAEDVVQEAFVKGYRALGSFRAGSAFRPWLLRIVANETRNAHRAWRRRATVELRVAVRPDERDPQSPERSAIAADTHATLLAAIGAMPDRDRLVLTCRYFLDLSEAETAQVLGWPRGSVKSRLSRALDKLRRALPARLAEEVTGGH